MANFIVIHVGRTSPVAQSRADLARRIRNLPGAACLDLDCAWLVESDDTADEIRDNLTPSLPPEDALLVFGIGEQAAWAGLREEQADWLVQHL
jgi:hypothetical protein